MEKKREIKKGAEKIFFLLLTFFSVIDISIYSANYLKSEKIKKETDEMGKCLVASFYDSHEMKTEEAQKVDFSSLKNINEDIIGWIYIEDTNINYPLLKSKNNSQYLFQSFNKEYNIEGSIFLDYRFYDFDKTAVIYGHNMKNGDMFGELDKYCNKNYLTEHNKAEIYLSESVLEYEVIFSDYMDLSEISEMILTEDEGKLLLITCTDESSNKRRFVVIAERRRETYYEKR